MNTEETMPFQPQPQQPQPEQAAPQPPPALCPGYNPMGPATDETSRQFGRRPQDHCDFRRGGCCIGAVFYLGPVGFPVAGAEQSECVFFLLFSDHCHLGFVRCMEISAESSRPAESCAVSPSCGCHGVLSGPYPSEQLQRSLQQCFKLGLWGN